MDLRRLRLLVELSRLGSMREVADLLNITTSTVSQQLAALTSEVRTPLLEPDGRRVRLTPAGRRLADHAVTILAAVEAAQLDLDPQAEPAGTLRVAGFATAIRRSLLPVIADLAVSHPRVGVTIQEYEPLEAFALLAADEVDLVLAYDYNLAPASLPVDAVGPTTLVDAVGSRGAGAGRRRPISPRMPIGRGSCNSRNTADEDAVRTLASLAGFTPRIEHWIDSLELVAELILHGRGIGLMPLGWSTPLEVRVIPLTDPPLLLRRRSPWFAADARPGRPCGSVLERLELLADPAE